MSVCVCECVSMCVCVYLVFGHTLGEIEGVGVWERRQHCTRVLLGVDWVSLHHTAGSTEWTIP